MTREPEDGQWERRSVRVGRRPSRDAEDAADATTDRHAVSTGSARDDDRGPDTSGWLLGASDDRDGERSVGVSSDAVTEALPHGRTAARQARRARRARRRTLVWAGAAVVLLVALVAGLVLARGYYEVLFPPDYDGPGSGRVVVEVAEGESTRAIGEALVAQDVVASARTFGDAAEDDPDGRGIQPGFYELRRQMSAADAVTALLDPASRLGRLEIRPGTQLDDTLGAGQSITPGVLSLIARATCRPDEAGAERCASTEDVREVMVETDPADLGVPAWALTGVRAADPVRRLEGLLAAGTYDLAPGLPPREALEQVVRESVPRLEATGVVEESRTRGLSPYAALVVASLAEKEGVQPDFAKVTRVIFNRLAIPMRLQFDSTINYPLDRQQLLTTPFDRGRAGPYNSYLNLGLPPTPIAAPSRDAIRAALEPAPGPWVYFVKCRTDGISCFAVTMPEHDENRRLAQARGAY